MIRSNLKSNGGALNNGEYIKLQVGQNTQSGTITNNRLTLPNDYASCIVGVSGYNSVTLISASCKAIAFNDIDDLSELNVTAAGNTHDISNYTYVYVQALADVSITFA